MTNVLCAQKRVVHSLWGDLREYELYLPPCLHLMSTRLLTYSSYWRYNLLISSLHPFGWFCSLCFHCHLPPPGHGLRQDGVSLREWIVVLSVGYPDWVIPPDFRHVQDNTNSPAGEGLPPPPPFLTKRKGGVAWERGEKKKMEKVEMVWGGCWAGWSH